MERGMEIGFDIFLPCFINKIHFLQRRNLFLFFIDKQDEFSKSDKNARTLRNSEFGFRVPQIFGVRSPKGDTRGGERCRILQIGIILLFWPQFKDANAKSYVF